MKKPGIPGLVGKNWPLWSPQSTPLAPCLGGNQAGKLNNNPPIAIIHLFEQFGEYLEILLPWLEFISHSAACKLVLSSSGNRCRPPFPCSSGSR